MSAMSCSDFAPGRLPWPCKVPSLKLAPLVITVRQNTPRQRARQRRRLTGSALPNSEPDRCRQSSSSSQLGESGCFQSKEARTMRSLSADFKILPTSLSVSCCGVLSHESDTRISPFCFSPGCLSEEEKDRLRRRAYAAVAITAHPPTPSTAGPSARFVGDLTIIAWQLQAHATLQIWPSVVQWARRRHLYIASSFFALHSLGTPSL